MSDKGPLLTMTGEYHQPVRLHYRVLHHKTLLASLGKLRCIADDPTRDRRVWLYDHEARSLRFKQTYDQIPEQYRPIIIGSLFVRNKNTLLVDLRSHERALAAIDFFDKRIPRKAAQVIEFEVINKLFPAESANHSPDAIFDQQKSTCIDPTATMMALAEASASISDPREKMEFLLQGIEAHSRKRLPEIERFPVHYYSDGLGPLAAALSSRQLVAMQHWLGNTDYTLGDVIKGATSGLL